MNPHAVQADPDIFPPANSKSALKMRARYNERLKSASRVEDTVIVVFEAWKGAETSYGIRVVRFALDLGQWRFETETWIPTPRELTSRKGYQS